MKLTINDNDQPVPANVSTLGDLLDHVETGQKAQGLFLIKVHLDGQEANLDDPATRDTDLAPVETVDLQFTSLALMADKNLDNAKSYLDRLIPGIEKASDLFRTGSEQEANKFLLNIIDGVDWFSEVVDAAVEAKKLDPETWQVKGQSLQQWKARLLELTSQLLEANKNKDWVLLADLLEYEIHPYYVEWVDILPCSKKPPDKAITRCFKSF